MYWRYDRNESTYVHEPNLSEQTCSSKKTIIQFFRISINHCTILLLSDTISLLQLINIVKESLDSLFMTQHTLMVLIN